MLIYTNMKKQLYGLKKQIQMAILMQKKLLKKLMALEKKAIMFIKKLGGENETIFI